MSAARSETAAPALEIVITRVFDAPRELVFAAFTNPEHAGKWWGPRGFTTTTHAHDLRVGGAWRFTMHGQDGTDFPNRIVYREIARPERLVYAHGDFENEHFLATITFATEGQGTRVAMRALFPSAEACAAARKFGAVEGGEQMLDRLTQELVRGSAKKGSFVFARSFAAPRELVFKAWTEPERLAHWWGPTGMKVSVLKLELRPGGTFHYRMQTPDGQDWFGTFLYREIRAPERLAFLVSFADAECNPVRHPLASTWPLEMLNTVTFSECAGRTTLVLVSEPHQACPEECQFFEANFGNMEKGYGGTLEQLATYLARG